MDIYWDLDIVVLYMRKIHLIIVSVVVIAGSACLSKSAEIYDGSEVLKDQPAEPAYLSSEWKPDNPILAHDISICERYAEKRETDNPTYNSSDFIFSTEEERKVFITLDACIARLNNFNSNLPYQYGGGNSVYRYWTGEYDNLPLCGEISTTTYGMKDVFGVGFSFENKVSVESDWSTKFSFGEGSEMVYGDTLAVAFKNDNLKIFFDISGYFSERIFDDTSQYVSTALEPRKDSLELLVAYLDSAPSFRKEYKKQITDFKEALGNFMVSGKTEICARWKYGGGSIPPYCESYRKATDEEIESEKQRILGLLNFREEIFDEYYEEMYGALVNSFPFKECGF